MQKTVRGRVFDALEQRVDPRLVAYVSSVVLSVRSRSRCSVRYDGGDWVHRYPGGVVVNTRPGGLPAELQDRAAADIVLYDYTPRPGDTVIDIGAGVGGEVRLFSRLVGETGRVVSIEAHPVIFRCLQRTVELNRLTNVRCLECAVVGSPGPVFLEDDQRAHIANGLTTDPARGVKVDGRRLDEIVSSLGIDRIDLLKMNIEGAELDVLAGSFEALTAVRNVVVSCHDFKAETSGADWQRTFLPVTTILSKAGFRIRTRPHDVRPWVRYYVYASR